MIHYITVAKFKRAIKPAEGGDTFETIVQEVPSIVAHLLGQGTEEECRHICSE